MRLVSGWLVIVVVMLMVSGCRWFNDDKGMFVNRADDYVDADESAPLEIPEDLSSAAVQDVMVVPPTTHSGRRVMYADGAPRPEAIFARDEAEGVKIQKLGDRRWLLVPQSPAVVWPKVVQFFADNGIAIASEDPDAGHLTTAWFGPDDGSARDVVRLSIASGREEAKVKSGRDRVKVAIEQGIRERTSEVHLRYENDSLRQPSETALPEVSDVGAVEVELVGELGSYLASNVGDESVSFVARNISTQVKAELIRTDDNQPALRLTLEFDRAWAMINQALADAAVPITDVDRTEGIVYATVTDKILNQESESWFLVRWLTRDEKPRPVEVRMVEEPGGYQVLVFDAKSKPLPIDTAEQVLLLIREYAT